MKIYERYIKFFLSAGKLKRNKKYMEMLINATCCVT